MHDPLILITSENCELYRLHMYHDFIDRISLYHKNVVVYGEGYDGKNTKYISSYKKDKTLNEVINEDLSGHVPEVIFIINADFASSDLSQFKSKVYVFNSDSIITNKHHVSLVKRHKFNCKGVFYNYLYGDDLIESTFNTKNKFYFPCWSSIRYDYTKYNINKNIDFYMSGVRNQEYSYRYVFSDIFKKTKLNYIDRFDANREGYPKKEDHDFYIDSLGKSRYSPHDGGINGRIQGRFYESSYMKSVVVAPDLGKEMRINGFENGINSILFDRNSSVNSVANMINKIDEIYDWKKLSDNAYDLIKTRHTTGHRIKTFLDIVLNN